MQNDYKPWEEYPEIWPTESKFWTWLRGSLRRGLWEKSPVKLSYKNANCSKPPEGYVGKAKSGAYCALTGEWVNKSKLEVDHIDGHKSLLCWEDVLPFILHLVPPKGSLALVDKEAHKCKSYSERKGISFEEALIEKKIIAWEKDKSVQHQEYLLSLGYSKEQTSNAKKRRDCYREVLLNGK